MDCPYPYNYTPYQVPPVNVSFQTPAGTYTDGENTLIFDDLTGELISSNFKVQESIDSDLSFQSRYLELLNYLCINTLRDLEKIHEVDYNALPDSIKSKISQEELNSLIYELVRMVVIDENGNETWIIEDLSLYIYFVQNPNAIIFHNQFLGFLLKDFKENEDLILKALDNTGVQNFNNLRIYQIVPLKEDHSNSGFIGVVYLFSHNGDTTFFDPTTKQRFDV